MVERAEFVKNIKSIAERLESGENVKFVLIHTIDGKMYASSCGTVEDLEHLTKALTLHLSKTINEHRLLMSIKPDDLRN